MDENILKKQIKDEMEYINKNKVFLFLKCNEAAARFTNENKANTGEICFSQTSDTWSREDVRKLIEFLEIKKIYFPGRIFVDNMKYVVEPINKPYPLQLKDISWNYRNKLIFLLKLKKGVGITVSRLKLLKNQKYIVLAKINKTNIEFYQCDSYNTSKRTLSNFIPIFTSLELTDRFIEEHKDDALMEYKPLILNYKRIEKIAIKNKQDICINCSSPSLKQKDFSYNLSYEFITDLKKSGI